MYDANYYKSADYNILLIKKIREKMEKKSTKTKESMTEENRLVIVMPKMMTVAFSIVTVYFGLQILGYLTYLFTY